MLNDRDKVNKPSSQIGFIELIMLPFVEAMIHIFPTLDCTAAALNSNAKRWKDIWLAEEAHDEAAVEKMNVRVSKIHDRCIVLDRSCNISDGFQARAHERIQ